MTITWHRNPNGTGRTVIEPAATVRNPTAYRIVDRTDALAMAEWKAGVAPVDEDAEDAEARETTECRPCKGVGTIPDTRVSGVTHKRTTVNRKCRPCDGTGRIVPLPATPVVHHDEHDPKVLDWMTGWDDELPPVVEYPDECDECPPGRPCWCTAESVDPMD